MAKAKGKVERPSLAWQGANYPRVAPGNYEAVCVGWQGPDWVRRYHRWSLRLEFCLLSEGECVSGFFNMGSSKRKFDIGPRSRFRRVWTLANGEMPRKGQQMTLETFTDEGLLYVVKVADAVNDDEDQAKPDALIYSRVIEVLGVQRK